MDRSIGNHVRVGLLAGVAALVITSVTAEAQEPETVTVTSTRLNMAGFNAPTPTTVIGTDLIETINKPNLFDAVNQIPALMGSASGQTGQHGTSQGNNGLDSFNLFALGIQRTLTLLDGQRFVAANIIAGVPDVGAFPHALVQRVDVVTGGASASWGSDALAGVVNFITEKKFVGFKGNVSAGISTYGDNATIHGEFAAGTSFLQDRGHVEVSVEYDHTDGVPGGAIYGINQQGGRTWYKGQKQAIYASPAATPAGQPQVWNTLYAQDNQRTQYALINSGPLEGTAFGPNGTTYQFNYGVGLTGVQGTPAKDGSATAPGNVNNCVTAFCKGGELAQDIGGADGLAQARTRGNFYTRLSYDLTPDTNVYMTADFADVGTQAVSFPGMGFSGLAGVPANTNGQIAQLGGIQCGLGPTAANLPAGDLSGPNAFLPASINQACISNNIRSFGIGSTMASLPPNWVRTERLTWRIAAGVDGAFSLLDSDWTWSSYFTHGETRGSDHVSPLILYPYFYAAVDSVVATAGDGSGATPGTIICRNATARAEGCVPFNVFNNGPATKAQMDWVYGNGKFQQPYQHQDLWEDAAAVTFNGTPFSTWAGKVAVATGVEYRNESFVSTADGAGAGSQAGTNGQPGTPCVDPLLNCLTGNNWYAANFHNGRGSFHVTEGFVELGVPLLDSVDIGRLDLSVAGRFEKYKPAGDFVTWKVGLNYDTPIQGLRLRTLMSRDVHTPTLNDLFAPALISVANVTDPWIGTKINTLQVTGGNPNLKPERSINSQLGVVYQPDWLPGFQISADYYRVYISDAIGSVQRQTSIDNCFAGLTSFCSAITVNGAGTPATNSNWFSVANTSLNIASLVTDGFNFESVYKFSLDKWGVPGEWTLRTLAVNVSKYKNYPGLPGTFVTEMAGNNDGDVMHWRIVGYQTYDAGKWSVTLSERWVSQGEHDRSMIQCVPGTCPLSTLQNPTVNDNHVPSIVYFNVGGTYDINEDMKAYFQIDNMLNKDPPPYFYNSYIPRVDNESLYDPIGRMFRVGLRFKN